MKKTSKSFDKAGIAETGIIRWNLPNGRLHREDGPAVEWPDGSKEWYLDGKRHREDGPAVESSDGVNEWYIRGKKLLPSEYPNLPYHQHPKLINSMLAYHVMCE
jgi:hypothetical protein